MRIFFDFTYNFPLLLCQLLFLDFGLFTDDDHDDDGVRYADGKSFSVVFHSDGKSCAIIRPLPRILSFFFFGIICKENEGNLRKH